MKKILTIILMVLMLLGLCAVTMADIVAVEHDGQITYYDSEESALKSYSGSGSIWSTEVVKKDELYSPNDNYSSDEEHSFWKEIKEEILSAQKNSTIDVYCYGYAKMDVSVMRALYSNPSISLSMHSDFGDFLIPSGYLVEIEEGRITYPVYQLYLLYLDMANWGTAEVKEPEKIEEPKQEIVENIVVAENKVVEEKKVEEPQHEISNLIEKEPEQKANNSDSIYIVIIALLSLLVIILLAIIVKNKTAKEKIDIL